MLMKPIQDPLPVIPFTRPLRNPRVFVPGSKSISNRALLLASLTNRKVRLNGLLQSEDVHWMLDCLRRLGVCIDEIDSETVVVHGCGGVFPAKQAELQVGTAGTVARLLVGILGAQPSGRFRVDGSDAMRKRPMAGILDFLAVSGSTVHFEETPGRLPIVIEPSGIRGGKYRVDASESSQILSGILMAGALAQDPIVIELQGETVSHPFIEMTLRMMEAFGASEVRSFKDPVSFTISDPAGYPFNKDHYLIERDATAASYFVMLPKVVGGSLRIADFVRDGLQGDAAFQNVAERVGGVTRLITEGASQDLEVTFPHTLRHPDSIDFNAISDTFLSLAAVAPLLSRPIHISGIAHTRKQESDRVHAMATELRKLGQTVDECEDSLRIVPSMPDLIEAARSGVVIDTYRDHRVAMSFAILGCRDLLENGQPWMEIRDPGCCAKTFPDFFTVLESLRQTTFTAAPQ